MHFASSTVLVWFRNVHKNIANLLSQRVGCHRNMDKQYNRLVEISNLCKTTWLRETPKTFATTFNWKLLKESRVMTSDIVKTQRMLQWAIRRREPNTDMIGNGSVSETAKALANNDGLINLNSLKVQSTLPGNLKESAWGGLAFSN